MPRRPVELGQEPAESTALYGIVHAKALLDNWPPSGLCTGVIGAGEDCCYNRSGGLSRPSP